MFDVMLPLLPLYVLPIFFVKTYDTSLFHVFRFDLSLLIGSSSFNLSLLTFCLLFRGFLTASANAAPNVEARAVRSKIASLLFVVSLLVENLLPGRLPAYYQGIRVRALRSGGVNYLRTGKFLENYQEATKGAFLSKRDYVMFAVIAVLGVASFATIGVLTVLEGPEWVKFVIAMFFFITVLIGSYLYVIGPQKKDSERNTD